MQQHKRRPLWSLLAPADAPPGRFITDPYTRLAIHDLARETTIDAPLEALRGRSVMISTERQLTAALALMELDGIARRMLLCTPDMSPTHVGSAITDAEIDIIVTDGGGPAKNVVHDTNMTFIGDRLKPREGEPDRNVDTEWLLLTSGTTGRPKLAVHTLTSLVGPLDDGLVVQDASVWSTFYDIRRYGGLQILLRAFVGGGSMVLSSAGEPIADFLSRAGAGGVTHISGTPSHWRRTLMSAAAGRMKPRYVRLSGEACDQAILDNLQQAYPGANVAHAFASTEAGVAFDVRDGRAGFPASLIGQIGKDVSVRVEDGSLRIRSSRVATRVIGNHGRALSDTAGYVDTGDIVELRGDRYYFAGRREGIINVGGLKVHPETIEAVINQHPAVYMSRVSGRASPITGAIAVAEVVVNPSATTTSFKAIRNEILGLCQNRLQRHEVPVTIREVASLEIAASGKLVRRHA